MEPTIFEIVSDFLLKWLPMVATFVGTFAIIATMTNNKSDDRIVKFLQDLINFFAANVGKAKNDPDV